MRRKWNDDVIAKDLAAILRDRQLSRRSRFSDHAVARVGGGITQHIPPDQQGGRGRTRLIKPKLSPRFSHPKAAKASFLTCSRIIPAPDNFSR
jgi:hypothetical protein